MAMRRLLQSAAALGGVTVCLPAISDYFYSDVNGIPNDLRPQSGVFSNILAWCEHSSRYIPFYRVSGKFYFDFIPSKWRTMQIFTNKQQGEKLDDDDFCFLNEKEWDEFTKGYSQIIIVSIFGTQGIGKSTTLNALFFGDERANRCKDKRVALRCTPFQASNEKRCTKGFSAVLIPMPREFLPLSLSSQQSPTHVDPISETAFEYDAASMNSKSTVGLMLVDAEGLFDKSDTRGTAMLMRLWSISNVMIHLFNSPTKIDFAYIAATLSLLHTNTRLSDIYTWKVQRWVLKPHFIGFWIKALRIKEITNFSDYAKWFPGGALPDEVLGPQFCLSPDCPADDYLTETYFDPRDDERNLVLNPHDVRHRLKEYICTQITGAACTPAQIFATMQRWKTLRSVVGLPPIAYAPCSASCIACKGKCLESAAAPGHEHRNLVDSCTDNNAESRIACIRHRTETAQEHWGWLWVVKNYSCHLCDLERNRKGETVWAYTWFGADSPEFRKRFVKVGKHNFVQPDFKNDYE